MYKFTGTYAGHLHSWWVFGKEGMCVTVTAVAWLPTTSREENNADNPYSDTLFLCFFIETPIDMGMWIIWSCLVPGRRTVWRYSFHIGPERIEDLWPIEFVVSWEVAFSRIRLVTESLLNFRGVIKKVKPLRPSPTIQVPPQGGHLTIEKWDFMFSLSSSAVNNSIIKKNRNTNWQP